jgi:GNAT superfamily N-acetyltransferase
VNRAGIFAAYVEDRRAQEIESFTREHFADLVRFTPLDPAAEGIVAYARLTPGQEGMRIEEQVRHFEQMGRDFEWKVYDLDEPANLIALLEASGFCAGEEEAFMVCPLTLGFRSVTSVGDAWTIRRVHDRAGVHDIVTVQEQVWTRNFGWLADQMYRTLTRAPDALSIYCAYAGAEPIGSGWTDFPRGSKFPELHGGAVIRQWRGQGLYSALYGVRLAEARQRGYRYLTVDASPMSRPILERLGFEYVCRTVPMHRKVGSSAYPTRQTPSSEG